MNNFWTDQEQRQNNGKQILPLFRILSWHFSIPVGYELKIYPQPLIISLEIKQTDPKVPNGQRITSSGWWRTSAATSFRRGEPQENPPPLKPNRKTHHPTGPRPPLPFQTKKRKPTQLKTHIRWKPPLATRLQAPTLFMTQKTPLENLLPNQPPPPFQTEKRKTQLA